MSGQWGLGCDLCKISEMDLIVQGRDPALERLFTEQERQDAMSQKQPTQHLAGIFAAKEALAKAIKEPSLLGSYHQEVSLLHRDNGAPVFDLSEPLRQRLLQRGIRIADVSISHDGEYAMAAVLIERNDAGKSGPAAICSACLLSLEHLSQQRITNSLLMVIRPDGSAAYLCPPCARGW